MVVSQTLPKLPELTVEQAEHWVAAALAEEKALRQHDGQLYPDTADASALAAAHELHTAWRHWADEAELLLGRIRPLLDAKRHVGGADDLDYAARRARAMLKLTPETIQARREQVRRGEVLTAEEVRRELRLSPQR